MTNATAGRVFDRSDTALMLALLHAPGEPIALRTLKPEEEKHFGDPDAALDWAAQMSGKRPLYAVLNPIDPGCRQSETWKSAAKDEHIRALRWLPLDADPKRAPDTCSTEAELAAAKARMSAVLSFLRGEIPCLDQSIVRALSGNGAHGLIRLPDYPPSETPRLKRIGDALAAMFSDDAVSIDRTVFNPARIWRVYGTLNVKGANTPERPHRLARLLIEEGFEPVPLDLLAHENELLNALGWQEKQKKPRKTRTADSQDDADTERTGTPSLPSWWTDAVPAGQRNQTAFARARWLLNGTEGNCTEEAAWALLKAWNTTCCRPSLDTQELRTCFASAQKGGDNPKYRSPAPSPTTSNPWPVPSADAFYGLAGDIVRAIEPHTEADPVALLVQMLLAFGSSAGRAPHFIAEADKHSGNLFAVLVGMSSKGRKGSSWGHIRRLFTSVDPHWESGRLLSGLSSGEGLIHAVRDPLEKEETDKKSGERQTVVIDAGVQDKRLLVMESEFASVLRQTQRDGNTLSATLRNAWDTGSLRCMTKNSPSQATGAHISIIGHITAQELRKDLAETETANGFGNRFLWVCVKRSKELPEGGDIDSVGFSRLLRSLGAALSHARTVTRLQRDGTAREIWHAVYHDLSTGKPGLLGAMTGRSEAQVMRLALLYALLDSDTAIRADHLTAALALWEYCEASARFIFGESLGDRLADDILKALRESPGGMTRTDLRDLFQKHHSTGQALSLLTEHGLIRSERQETGGRPIERYFAV